MEADKVEEFKVVQKPLLQKSNSTSLLEQKQKEA